MNLIKWNDFDNRLPSMFSAFDDIFGRDYFKSLAEGISVPAMNIKERENDFLLSFAIPGIDKKDCKVNVEGGVLKISGEKESSEEAKGDYTRHEYNYSSFSRSFVLPENVNTEDITANYTNGELKINLPKQEIEKEAGKTIEIE